MLFYFFFISILFVLLGDFNVGVKFTKRARYAIAVILVLLMSMLRFDVGFDYSNYYEMIWRSGGDEWKSEAISRLLMDIGYECQFPPLTFALYSILTYGIVAYVFYKYSKNFTIALFVYLCLFFLETLGGIRQSLAEAVVLLGYPYMIEKKFGKYLMIIAIATLVHKSAIIAILIYPLYNYLNIKWTILAGILIIIFARIIITAFVGVGVFGAAANHIDQADEFSGGGKLMFVMLFISILSWIICKIRRLKVNYNLFSVIFLGIFIPFMIGAHYGMRVGKYFTIYLCFLIPQIISYYKSKVRIFVMSIGVAYFMIFISVGWNKKRPTIAPYQTIFQIEDVSNPKFLKPD